MKNEAWLTSADEIRGRSLHLHTLAMKELGHS